MSSFSIDSSSGALTFNTAPDYETKNSYSITVSVSDDLISVNAAITINVTDVNEAPVISSTYTEKILRLKKIKPR